MPPGVKRSNRRPMSSQLDPLSCPRPPSHVPRPQRPLCQARPGQLERRGGPGGGEGPREAGPRTASGASIRVPSPAPRHADCAARVPRQRTLYILVCLAAAARGGLRDSARCIFWFVWRRRRRRRHEAGSETAHAPSRARIPRSLDTHARRATAAPACIPPSPSLPARSQPEPLSGVSCASARAGTRAHMDASLLCLLPSRLRSLAHMGAVSRRSPLAGGRVPPRDVRRCPGPRPRTAPRTFCRDVVRWLQKKPYVVVGGARATK